MSTTTTNVRPHEQVAAEPGVAGTGSLFRAELHRFRARRFIQLLLALSVLAFLAGTVVAYTQHSKPTPAILAEARAEMQEQMRMAEESRQQCLQDESIPEAEREMACGPPPSEQGMELEWFLDKRAFVLAENIATGVVAGSVVTAALLFVIGATFIGAEWSTRSIVALLFWQPRRLKVLAVKAAVTALVATVLAVAAQAAWTAAAMLLAKLRGRTDVPKEFWSNVLEAQGRGVLLVVLFALLGLGMANLLRNTGAALGVAFAYPHHRRERCAQPLSQGRAVPPHRECDRAGAEPGSPDLRGRQLRRPARQLRRWPRDRAVEPPRRARARRGHGGGLGSGHLPVPPARPAVAR